MAKSTVTTVESKRGRWGIRSLLNLLVRRDDEPGRGAARYAPQATTISEQRIAKTRSLIASGSFQSALSSCESFIRDFDESILPASQADVTETFLNTALALLGCGRYAEAKVYFQKVLVRFDDGLGSDRLDAKMEALFGLGVVFGRLGDHRRALAAYDSVLLIQSETVDQFGQLLVYRARLNKGHSLAALKRHGAAIEIFEDLASSDAGNNADFRSVVREASKAKDLWLFDSPRAHATTLFKNLVYAFSHLEGTKLRESIARAMHEKILDLERERRFDEATDIFAELLARFDGSSEVAVLSVLFDAMIYRRDTYGLGSENENELVFVVAKLEQPQNTDSARYLAYCRSLVLELDAATLGADINSRSFPEPRSSLDILPDNPPRVWTPKMRGRPASGTDSDMELIEFIREVYGQYFEKNRSTIRAYIFEHDRPLYRKIYRFEAKGKLLPDDIQMPSERQNADERRVTEAVAAKRRLVSGSNTSRGGRPLVRRKKHRLITPNPK